jgi:hypothetical protein
MGNIVLLGRGIDEAVVKKRRFPILGQIRDLGGNFTPWL